MLPRSTFTAMLRDRSAIAFTEFAYALPIFLTLGLTGAEITNYVTTKMRASQVALHAADHASRMGSGSLLAAKTISESQINDVLTGAGLQAGNMALYTHGRVIISSLEPVANPNPSRRYRIAWQRCRGAATQTSSYGVAGQTNMTGMGPAGRQVTAPEGGATMFVEVHYTYQPLISARFLPNVQMSLIASMMVRDRRDLTRIYNAESAPVSAC